MYTTPSLAERLYDALLRVKGSRTTNYPDCTGLLVNFPNGSRIEVRKSLIAAGKVVQFVEDDELYIEGL